MSGVSTNAGTQFTWSKFFASTAFVLTPLTYFGGVFYTVSMLPPWAQKVSYANPILYMVNAFRHGFFGVSDVDVGLAFTIMIVAALVLFAAALTMLNKGMGVRE